MHANWLCPPAQVWDGRDKCQHGCINDCYHDDNLSVVSSAWRLLSVFGDNHLLLSEQQRHSVLASQAMRLPFLAGVLLQHSYSICLNSTSPLPIADTRLEMYFCGRTVRFCVHRSTLPCTHLTAAKQSTSALRHRRIPTRRRFASACTRRIHAHFSFYSYLLISTSFAQGHTDPDRCCLPAC